MVSCSATVTHLRGTRVPDRADGVQVMSQSSTAAIEALFRFFCRIFCKHGLVVISSMGYSASVYEGLGVWLPGSAGLMNASARCLKEWFTFSRTLIRCWH